jgi:hypothetical protein
MMLLASHPSFEKRLQRVTVPCTLPSFPRLTDDGYNQRLRITR